MEGITMSAQGEPQLPVTYEVGSFLETPDGRVARLTLFLLDQAGTAYSLVVTTPEGMLTSEPGTESEPETLEYDDEPVFVLPGDNIRAEDIDDLLSGVSSHLLARYVVPQIDENLGQAC